MHNLDRARKTVRLVYSEEMAVEDLAHRTPGAGDTPEQANNRRGNDCLGNSVRPGADGTE